MPAKSSPMVSIPTSVLKSCSDVLAPLITRLAELSFRKGVFPTGYKTAAVTPLLKKKGLDKDEASNYRPISNLHTVSKIIERLFLSRIVAHVEQSPCYNKLQSAYRRGHSTETALLRLTNDVYCGADKGHRTLLIQLDLSAAFDMIDVNIMLRRLEQSFGLTGTTLNWIKLYATGRKQYVRFGDYCSTTTMNNFGVPQGSVLGPMLFSLYVAPIADVIKSYDVMHAQYADDTQLYIGLSRASALTMDTCFAAVHRWFEVNGLALNPDKSEAIVIGTGARHRQEGEIGSVRLGDVDIHTSDSVRSLGVTIDRTLSFNQHVNNICKASFCHIRALHRIRPLITTDDAKAIATAVVLSRLDYCNSLLYGTSSANLQKLQRVQNALPRTVVSSSCRPFKPSAPILADLHWLPVAARIKYKVALLTFKTMTTRRPAYLADLIQQRIPARQLRSSQHFTLHDSGAKTVFGSRAFCHSAPTVWNSLPSELTANFCLLTTAAFKRHLKTVLFRDLNA
jgi:hypothetical protein